VLVVVFRQMRCFRRNTVEDIIDKRVHDAHRSV
jgi:hypothetical protein